MRESMKEDFWTWAVPGIGDETGKKIVLAMYRGGLIDEEFETYKEVSSKEYYLEKYVRMKN